MADASNNEPYMNIVSTSTLCARNSDPDPNPNINVNTNANIINNNNNVNQKHNSFHEFSLNARNFNLNCRGRRDDVSQRGSGMFIPFICIVMHFFIVVFVLLFALFLNHL